MENNKVETIDLNYYIKLILKKWYWFVIGCVITVIIAILYILCTTQKFEVTSSIRIQTPSRPNILSSNSMLSMLGFGSTSIQDEMTIISSARVLRPVVEQFDLQYEYRKRKGLKYKGQFPKPDVKIIMPALYTDTMISSVSIDLKCKNEQQYSIKISRKGETYKYALTSLAEPLETVLGTLRFQVNRPMKAGGKERIKIISENDAIEVLKERIIVSQVQKDGSIISLFTLTDMPGRDRKVIDAIVESYNTYQDEQTSNTSQTSMDYLNDRLAMLTQSIDSIEQVRTKFVQDENLTGTESEIKLLLQEASNNRLRLVELISQISVLEYDMKVLSNDTLNNDPLPSIPNMSLPSINKLLDTYNEQLLAYLQLQRTATYNNPLLDQTRNNLMEMRNSVRKNLEQVCNGLKIQQEQLEKQEQRYMASLSNVPQQEQTLANIIRQEEMLQTLYAYMYQQKEENLIVSLVKRVPIEIIDVASINWEPKSPRKKLTILIALIIGCFIPFCILIAKDILTGVAGTHTILQQTKLSSIGEIKYTKTAPKSQFIDKSLTKVKEQIRSVRENVLRLAEQTNGKTILVTSAGLNEGKTYCSVNLAHSLALLKKKVVLVEGNMKKPQLAEAVGENNTNNNYLNYLQTENTDLLASLLQKSSLNEHLFTITLQESVQDSNEILHGRHIKTMFDMLKQEFDYVIIDTANLTQQSDTQLLLPLADLTVVTFRNGITSQDNIQKINTMYAENRFNNATCVIVD